MTRIVFQEELTRLEKRAMKSLGMAAAVVKDTQEALATHDPARAREVIAGDDRLDRRYSSIHNDLLQLIALQAPVASDLRLVGALLQTSRIAERMGDYCVNIAKLIIAAQKTGAESPEILSLVLRECDYALEQIALAEQAFTQRDTELACRLPAFDARINSLNRECFEAAVSFSASESERRWGMFMTLVSRNLERLGDATVDIAEQLVYLVTGELEEMVDSSHPEDPTHDDD